MRGPPCANCKSVYYDAVKVKLPGTYCADCGALDDRPLAAFVLDASTALPCGHDWLKNAMIRTKDMMRCVRCFQGMHEMSARLY